MRLSAQVLAGAELLSFWVTADPNLFSVLAGMLALWLLLALWSMALSMETASSSGSGGEPPGDCNFILIDF